MTQSMPVFEDFEYRGVSKNDKRPAVSLQTRGAFMFNRAAYELLGRPKAVKIKFASQERIVGFQASEEGERGAFTVRKANNAESYNVAARSFANYYDIDISETRRYGVTMYGDVMGINLDDPDTRSNRARTKE